MADRPNPKYLFPKVQLDRAPRLDNLKATPAAMKADAQKILEPLLDVFTTLAGGPVKLALQAATYSPSAEAAIRLGGRGDLNLTHETSVAGLLKMLTGRGNISNPSFAVSSDNVAPFTGRSAMRASIIGNPAYHGYNPKTAVANQLTSRDAFATRDKGLLPKEVRTDIDPLSLSLTEEAFGTDAKFFRNMPGAQFVDSPQHMLSILASPRFKSFEDFERSRYGARVLDPEKAVGIPAVSEEIKRRYPDMEAYLKSPQQALELVTESKRRAKLGDKESQTLLDVLNSAHSNYAELKIPGQLPITGKTVSAAMLHPEVLDEFRRINPDADNILSELKTKAAAKGVRVGTPLELLPEQHQDLYMDLANTFEKEAKGGKAPSDLAKKYGFNEYTYKDLGAKDATLNAYDLLVSSDKFAADVASILTRKDADEIEYMLSRDAGYAP